jgi:hypothetical protein
LGEEGGLNLYGFVGNNPVSAVDWLGLELKAILIRDPGPAGKNPRRMAGTFTLTDGNTIIINTRANEYGFEASRQGVPIGEYTIQPKEENGVYPKGTPAVTGKDMRPGQPNKTYEPGMILIHKKGDTPNQADSRGCITIDEESCKKLQEKLNNCKGMSIPLIVK